MKKTGVVVLIISFVFACSRKTIPASDTNTGTPPPTIDTPKMDEAHATIIAQGKTIYTTRCNRCHKLKNVSKYTPAHWDRILKRMIPKARLNETEAQQVTAYVKEYAKK